MFQLSEQEVSSLRYQIGISKSGRGGRRYLPYVFTEQGIAMLSGVLHSPRAIIIYKRPIKRFIDRGQSDPLGYRTEKIL
jgi:hypothetical protein